MIKPEALSAAKEVLFQRYHRGEISFDDLSSAVFQIDNPPPSWPRKVLFVVLAAFLPLLFVGAGNQRTES